MQQYERIDCDTLHNFIKEILIRVGMSPQHADIETKVLMWADLRGEESHGVQVIPFYIENIRLGYININPRISIIRETPATLLIDADYALGPIVTIFAMERVMEKAKKTGIGWAFIRNTNHQGAMGYYPNIAATNGMIGLAWACSRANMAPFGARSAGTSNNPLAIAVPAKERRPLVLDMSTSIAAAAKIIMAREKGITIPSDWALDKNGKPTTDPFQADMLLPFAGPKGSGLSIMLECMTSVMVDEPKLEPVLQGDEEPTRLSMVTQEMRSHVQNSVVAAIDIGTFIDVEHYKEHIDNLIDGLKNLPPAEGCDEVLVPGERGWKTYDERVRNGITLSQKVTPILKDIAGRLGIESPFAV